jgi:hypothetical protein
MDPDTLNAMIATVITEIQTITKSNEETIRGGIRRMEVETSTLRRWQEKLQTAQNASKNASDSSTLSKILVNTEDIKKQLNTRPQPSAPSWNQVAAAMPATSWAARDQKHSQSIETKRKEVKITIKGQEDKQAIEKRDIQNILAAVRTREPREAVKEIIAARRLPSGDILLSTLTEKARIALERSKDWLRAIAPTAEILPTTFPVFVHGVRVKGANTNEQERTITAICEENARLHPGLEVTRIAWPKKTILEQKRYSSLVLETASPETANRIILQGLIHEGEIKNCVRFLSEGRVTRCHKCQRYGHTARLCRGEVICAECAEHHTAEACPKGPEAKRKCALCKGNHRAGSQSCELERKERQRAEYARNHAHPQYLCTSSSSLDHTNTTTAPPVPTQQQPQPPANGWQIITKRQRGRPSQLQQAANDPAQLQLSSTQLGKRKERDFSAPSPPDRTNRSQSQPAADSRNSFTLLDMDTDSE